jgi:Outer membrane protein beta-barrel domain
MKIYRFLVFTLATWAAAFLAPMSHAQTGVYGIGGGARLAGPNVGAGTGAGSSGSFMAYGGTFGLYHDFGHLGPAGFGLDGRGMHASSSNSTAYGNKVSGGFVGFRADLKPPATPVRVYAQAEIGAVTTNYGRYASSSGSAGTAYQIQVGADFTIVTHLDLRAEYAAGQVFGSGSPLGTVNLNLQQFGGGVVFRF